MATTTTTTERVELSNLRNESPFPLTNFTLADSRQIFINQNPDEIPEDTPYSTTVIPNGGYGSVIVAAGFITTFCQNGIINCWGVLQAALLNSTLKNEKASTLTFVGSALLISLDSSYFSSRLGLANGIIKLGGGVGGCVMAIALEAMYQRAGIEWTFRFQGFLTLAVGMPAAFLLKDRVPLKTAPFFDASMFCSIPFLATFIASAVGVFALYIPPYYLPLFAQSIGLSSATGAALVSAFNACDAIGRFCAGPLCDKVGPLNMFVMVMVVNAVSMLAIWPVSDTLTPLVIFATVNGIANGAYFTTQPTVVAGIFGPGRATVAMSMSVTGWSAGYLMGAPIAGYLLQAAGAGKQNAGVGQSVEVYRPAIFYAGGMATLSALFVILARLTVAKKVFKRV
ncbi:unnamed protein product [Alternaria sp. RS040]